MCCRSEHHPLGFNWSGSWVPGEFKFCKTSQESFRLVFTIEAELGIVVFAGASLVAQMVKKEKTKVAQSCQNLCNPMDYTVYGILQARILKWVAIPFSRGSSQPRDRTQVSHIAGRFFTSWATREAQEYWKERRKVRSHSRVQLFGTPWTVACQAPLSVEFSR